MCREVDGEGRLLDLELMEVYGNKHMKGCQVTGDLRWVRTIGHPREQEDNVHTSNTYIRVCIYVNVCTYIQETIQGI